MILISYGTRPEWIKLSPIISELKNRKIPHLVCFIKQHENLNFGYYDISIDIDDYFTTCRLNNIFASVLKNISVFKNVNKVMVHGDTASAFSMAISAFHNSLELIHVEAGLRTYDVYSPYPEEFYRSSIDKISNINFCPTEGNIANLIREGVNGKKYLVGSTVIDSLLKIDTDIFKFITSKNKDKNIKNCLITLHRRENRIFFQDWINNINFLAEKYKYINFIFIKHPSYEIKKYNPNNKLKIIDPVNYLEMIKLLKNVDVVISDSGGLQEETCFLKIPIIICRKSTERPEVLKLNGFLCEHPYLLDETFNTVLNKKIDFDYECPFGNGHSSEKIIDILYEK